MRSSLSSKLPWIASAALTVGLGAVSIAELLEERRLDNHCPASGPEAVNILLSDESDALHPSQVGRAGNKLDEIIRATGPTEMFLHLRIGGENEPDLVEVFEACNIANQKWSGSGWQRTQEKLFRRESRDRVDGLAESLRGTSPIFESIEALRRRGDLFQSGRVRIWVLSDFLQHSPLVGSDYKKPGRALPDPDPLAQGRFNAVTFLYVQRPGMGRLQTAPHRAKWLEYAGKISDAEPAIEGM